MFINKIRLVFSILILSIVAMVAQGQESAFDHFKINKDKVEVFFYDPLVALAKADDFAAKTDKEKSDLLDSYLHNNPLYLFSLTDSKTKDITYLCIRGNPEKVNTKMFYKVEVIKGISSASFNPNTDSYSDKIVKVIDQVNCGGTLFENMSLFQGADKKKYVGNGVQLFGYYYRVQPYSEIRSSMKGIIEQLQ